jgi:RNA polymerase sigma-70 factor (TIGR02943 family)
MSDTPHNPESWIELYADNLYQFALARVRNPELAEDLVQETFLAGIRGLDSFHGRSSIQTWLTAILKHKILDHYRLKWRETPMTDVLANQDGDPSSTLFDEDGHWLPGCPRDWGDPSRALQEADFLRVLRGCLSALPGRLATVFVLREMEELSSEEICSTLNIKDQNYWAMMHRSRARLRLCLETHWFEKTGSKP